MLDALKTKKAKAKAVADEAVAEAATKEAATKEQTMSAEDAAPAKAEAAVQIWHGFSSVIVTVTHIPAGLYILMAQAAPPEPRRPPVTLPAYCEPAGLLRLTLVLAVVLYACGWNPGPGGTLGRCGDRAPSPATCPLDSPMSCASR